MRNGNVEGGGLPPHYWDEKNKEVIFHIKEDSQQQWQSLDG